MHLSHREGSVLQRSLFAIMLIPESPSVRFLSLNRFPRPGQGVLFLPGFLTLWQHARERSDMRFCCVRARRKSPPSPGLACDRRRGEEWGHPFPTSSPQTRSTKFPFLRELLRLYHRPRRSMPGGGKNQGKPASRAWNTRSRRGHHPQMCSSFCCGCLEILKTLSTRCPAFFTGPLRLCASLVVGCTSQKDRASAACQAPWDFKAGQAAESIQRIFRADSRGQ